MNDTIILYLLHLLLYLLEHVFSIYFIIMFTWLFFRCTRLHPNQTGLAAEMKRISTIRAIRMANWFTLMTLACFALISVNLKMQCAVCAYYLVALDLLQTAPLRQFTNRAIALHQEQSVMSLRLGTLDHKENGTPLNIWFKKGKSDWPLVELETGVGHLATPIDQTDEKLMREEFIPRLRIAVDESPDHPAFLAMKQDLLSHGVTHPIDIKGWDCHPSVRNLIEKILQA